MNEEMKEQIFEEKIDEQEPAIFDETYEEENECDEADEGLAFLKKLAVAFVIIGGTIVIIKCKGKFTKWCIKKLEKMGYKVIRPEDQEAVEAAEEIDKTEETEETDVDGEEE